MEAVYTFPLPDDAAVDDMTMTIGDRVIKGEIKKREEARQARERQEAEQRRRQQQEEAREKAERKAVAAYWESLSPPEQADLQAQADAQADPATLANDAFPPLKRMGQQIRRSAYIRQLLKNREPAPAEG